MINKAVIDFSAFINSDKEFVVKELSISDIDSRCTQHWVLKSPKGTMQDDFKYFNDSDTCRHNSWLTKHYHGLDLGVGATEYESLYPTLDHICSRIRILYAATTEKARALEKILHGRRAVVSLELLGCPPLPREVLLPSGEFPRGRQQCLLHYIYAPGFCCTLENVNILSDWCSENLDRIEMCDPRNRAKTFRDWRCVTPSPMEMADHGFVQCTTVGDSTKCVYCGVVLFRWEEGDKVAKDHEYNSPLCKFVQYLLRQREDENTARKSAQCCRGFDTTDCADSTSAEPPSVYRPAISEQDLVAACRL